MRDCRQGIKTRSYKIRFFFLFSILKKPQKSCKIKENKRIGINVDKWAGLRRSEARVKPFQPALSERLCLGLFMEFGLGFGRVRY